MINSASAIYGLSATGSHTKPWVEGSVSIGLDRSEMALPDGNIAFTSSLFLQGASDVATLDLTDFSFTADSAAGVVATLTTSLIGLNNDLVYTAVPSGGAGNEITLTYTAPMLSSYETVSTVSRDTRITVTTGAKARMVATGFTGPLAALNLTYTYTVLNGGRPQYDNGTYRIYWTGSQWRIINTVGPATAAVSAQNVATPDLVTSWTPGAGAAPSVAALASSATQVKAAIAADNDSSDLVTVANVGGQDGTGAVTAMPSIPLTGGIDANGWAGAALDYQGDAFQAPDAILGILIWCSAGSFTIAGLSAGLESGEKFQRSRAAGVSDLLGLTLTATAGDDNSRLYIAVVAKA